MNEIEKWTVLQSEYIYKSSFGNLRCDKCSIPKGLVIDRYYVNEYPDWVSVVALTDMRELILVRQYRHGAGGIFTEVPSGCMEQGEDGLTAAMRELREETGYGAEASPVLLGDYYSNPANCNNRVQLYMVYGAQPAYSRNQDAGEDIEVLRYPFDDIDILIDEGIITNVLAVTAIRLAQKYDSRLTDC